MTHAPACVEIVSCGVFRKELAALFPSIPRAGGPVFFDSMLHMRPALLDATLSRLVARRAERRLLLLLYGDCSPHMLEFSCRPGVRRVDGVNCCEILLGHEAYSDMRGRGAFLFLPEWTRRWEEVFKHQLGFTDGALAREFMRDMHRCLVYLDTGVCAVPRGVLDRVAGFFGMPVEVRPVGLGHLRGMITEAMEHLAHG